MASAGGGAGSGQAGGYGQAGGSTAAGGAASTGTAAPATQSPQNLNQIVRLKFSCYAPRCDRRTSTNIPHHYLLLYIVLVIFYKHWGILGLVCAPGLESATVPPGSPSVDGTPLFFPCASTWLLFSSDQLLLHLLGPQHDLQRQRKRLATPMAPRYGSNACLRCIKNEMYCVRADGFSRRERCARQGVNSKTASQAWIQTVNAASQM